MKTFRRCVDSHPNHLLCFGLFRAVSSDLPIKRRAVVISGGVAPSVVVKRSAGRGDWMLAGAPSALCGEILSPSMADQFAVKPYARRLLDFLGVSRAIGVLPFLFNPLRLEDPQIHCLYCVPHVTNLRSPFAEM